MIMGIDHGYYAIKTRHFSFPAGVTAYITRYDSISGEELSPYRRLSAGCIKTYVGGYKPYQVIVHKNIPV